MEFSALNARPNDFRRVAYSEFENDHVHRVFRHFPELQSSLGDVKSLQANMGRNWVDRDPVRKERSREVSLKSTHHLAELSKSSLDEFRAPMDEMRKILMRSRSDHKSTSSIRSSDRHSTGPGDEAGPAEEEGQGIREALGDVAEALRVGQQKLTKASLSFNPTGTINVLAGFQAAELTISEFDSQLRRSLSIMLRKKELEALFGSMDADGSGLIDGVEFTRYFLQLGIDERKRHKMNVLRKTWAAEAEEKAQREAEKARILEWQAAQIQSFSAADEANAQKKLCTVALLWDSSSEINELKLRGFDMFLTPFDFKLQLSRSFDMNLSGAECGALLKRFISKEREGEMACVNGNAFLKYFIKLKKEVQIQHKSVLSMRAARKQHVRRMGQQEVLSKNLGR